MKLQLVAARRGAHWVRDGFRIMLRRPLAFCGLFVIYMLVGQVLMLLSPLGALVVFAMMPLGSLGFMLATRVALEQRFPGPGVFIEPLRSSREKRRAQITLGLIYAVALGAVLWVGDTIGGQAFETLQRAMASGKTTAEDLQPLLSNPKLQWGTLWVLSGAALLSVPFWFAPALVHWGSQSWGKALFFSTMACWRNKGAMLVYSLTWFGVIMLFGLASNVLVALFGRPQLMVLFAMPAMLMLSTAFYASLYFTFVDSFQGDEEVG